MKILVVTQYFWPENFLINDFCIGLKKRGHEIIILTGKPNYPAGKFFQGYNFFNKRTENWNGMKIYRAGLIPRSKGSGARLFINYFSFAFFASLRVWGIKEKIDKIFVYEPSPITVGIPAIMARMRYKKPIYFWVQDLWPETLTAAGGVKNKFVLGIIDKLTRVIYDKSEMILVQSKAFKKFIIKQGVPENKLMYFPNIAEDFFRVGNSDDRKKYAGILPDGFKIMFAGNIGNAQSFDTLLNAAILLKEQNVPVKWIILGDGRMKEMVEKKIVRHELGNVFFLLGRYPSTEMPIFFSCADALVVSLKKDYIFSLTIPSKVQSYLACGRPMIGSLDGEGALIIEEANAGFTAQAENHEALAECVKKMYNLTEEERNLLGTNGRQYFEKEFEREKLLEKLEKLMNQTEV